MIKFYKRSGLRVSKKYVENARDSYVIAKKTGHMGNLKCEVNLTIADRVSKMSAVEFSNWSGQFTYRISK
jgi:hypothetical protein